MAERNRDVLEVLKSELQFLESGGYECCLLRPWRPQLVFIESRTCMKKGAGAPQSCDGCVLMQFVPSEWHQGKTPCWHIPLNETGQTVDSSYRWGTEEELKQALKTWLWATILSIDEDRRASEITRRQGTQSSSDGAATIKKLFLQQEASREKAIGLPALLSGIDRL
jgi:hypothetical protein